VVASGTPLRYHQYVGLSEKRREDASFASSSSIPNRRFVLGADSR
jgi:hypothetical protein